MENICSGCASETENLVEARLFWRTSTRFLILFHPVRPEPSRHRWNSRRASSRREGTWRTTVSGTARETHTAATTSDQPGA